MNITDDPIREALDVVAQYRVTSETDRAEFQRRVQRNESSQKKSRRRWAALAVAAAVVVVVGIPLVLIQSLNNDHGAASPGPETADRAVVVGVSFPRPQGWSVTTIATTDTSVTACVAERPSTQCDGVTMQIALPAIAQKVTTVDSVPPKNISCGATNLFVWQTPSTTVGGREAHGWFWKCPPDGPVTVGWLVDDGSLAAWTSAASFKAQAVTILHDVDFSQSTWSKVGPLIVRPSSPESSAQPTSSVASVTSTR